MTHTYALLPIKSRLFYEIKKLLIDANYEHTFVNPETIDMNGIALTVEKNDEKVPSA